MMMMMKRCKEILLILSIGVFVLCRITHCVEPPNDVKGDIPNMQDESDHVEPDVECELDSDGNPNCDHDNDEYYYGGGEDYYYGEEERYEDEEEEVEEVEIISVADLPGDIEDKIADCQEWAEEGQCMSNPLFMLRDCIPSCIKYHFFEIENGESEEMKMLDLEDARFGLGKFGHVDDNMRVTEKCEDVYHPDQYQDSKNDDQLLTCEQLAEEGECYTEFMRDQCAKTCLICFQSGQEFELGVSQWVVMGLIKETLEVIVKTYSYMQKTVFSATNEDEKVWYDDVRRNCRNQDNLCSHWAAQGKCEWDDPFYEYMAINCAPACQTCELLDYEMRCPPPALNPGDLNAMFERLIGERELTPEQMESTFMTGKDKYGEVTVHSRPGKAEDDTDKFPWVITIQDFLTDEECNHLIEQGTTRGFEPSTEVGTEGDGSESEQYISDYRTSTNAWCIDECFSHLTTQRVLEKIAIATGIPSENNEDLQLLHYEPGEYYKSHHDYLGHLPRALTVFLYLADVEEGGGTRFNDLGIDIQPKKGTVLIWPNVLNEDPSSMDIMTHHEALPVLKGKKYGANAWLHLRDINNRYSFQCDNDIQAEM